MGKQADTFVAAEWLEVWFSPYPLELTRRDS